VLELNINPRDELARQSETTEIGERGGVVVDDQRRTSQESIYAIGEINWPSTSILLWIDCPWLRYVMVDVTSAPRLWPMIALEIKKIEGEEFTALTGADMTCRPNSSCWDVMSPPLASTNPDQTTQTYSTVMSSPTLPETSRVPPVDAVNVMLCLATADGTSGNVSATRNFPFSKFLDCGRLQIDRGEHFNLASEQPQRVQVMTERLIELRKGFFENDERGLDSFVPTGYCIDMSCVCWMAVNYYGVFLRPYQEIDIDWNDYYDDPKSIE
jgi:hypothetical protein